MKWQLKEVVQETSHPFLNYFSLIYSVNEKDVYTYYLAIRHSREELLPKTHDLTRPDGVLIPLYWLDDEGDIHILLTKQYRPAIGSYVYSVPAGLMDKDDKDILEVAKREALEEAGAIIDDLEIISYAGTTSSGLTDETNAIVMGRILSFEKQHLEKFEDIEIALYSKEEIQKILDDETLLLSNDARMAVMYMLLRFGNR